MVTDSPNPTNSPLAVRIPPGPPSALATEVKGHTGLASTVPRSELGGTRNNFVASSKIFESE